MIDERRTVDALLTGVRHHNRAVIDHEMRRLSGRAPGLSQHQVAVIEAALDDLAERLILARMRTMPDQAERLARLFDVRS
ncbi:hypothetical protein [Phytoactinopolyspora halotolerans]|uniref:Tetrapyrrole biosynthesis glutamyl-tRNA reductase dimerisation domain-containing protein n=1 Tax=Phytoactinopolyspora halotolerans TaxID=1981512 RepID=A0A6L9SE57_9ACTN|nr:hypothetical protein [Phytoactinopolyspora halotolerans]NEE03675.1 hypothetical protein [Phytoactinopolyspora halotolerans]